MRVALDTAYACQPPQYAQINRAHPLAQGLLGYWSMPSIGVSGWDYVSGLPMPANGTFTPKASPYGPAGTGVGLPSQSCCYTNRLGPFRIQFPITLFVVAMFNSLPGGTGIGLVSSAGAINATNSNLFAGIEIGYFNGVIFQAGNSGSLFRATLSSFSVSAGVWYVLSGSARSITDMSVYTNGVKTTGSLSGTASTMDYLNDTNGAGLGMLPGTAQHQENVSILCGGMWNRNLSDNEHMQLAKQPFCMFNRRPMPVAA